VRSSGTPLTVADGVFRTATYKEAPQTAALLRQQPEQVLERIVDVAALVGLVPRRNPVQARERHHMIEA